MRKSECNEKEGGGIRGDSYDVVGRVQEVGEEGVGLEADTADVRPHCWHCKGAIRRYT